jgi:hypothetical protein
MLGPYGLGCELGAGAGGKDAGEGDFYDAMHWLAGRTDLRRIISPDAISPMDRPTAPSRTDLRIRQ